MQIGSVGWYLSHTNSSCGWFDLGGDEGAESMLVTTPLFVASLHFTSPPPSVSARQIVALVCASILLKQTKREQRETTAYYSAVY